MDLSNDIESKGQDIITTLTGTSFTSILSSITTEKSNDFTLDDFACRKYGWASVEAELPALYVMGLREELIRDDGNNRWVNYQFAIEVYASSDDTEQLEKTLNRYARAITQRLTEVYRDDGTINGIDYSPVMQFEDSLYKVCSLQFKLRVFQDLT